MEYLFSDLKNIIHAFRSIDPPTNPQLAKAADTLSSRLESGEGLGYFRGKDSNEDSKILKYLADMNLTEGDKKTVLEYYKEKSANSTIKNSFYVRAFLSLCVVGGSLLYILASKNPNENIIKALFGLIGVVLGYWFK